MTWRDLAKKLDLEIFKIIIPFEMKLKNKVIF